MMINDHEQNIALREGHCFQSESEFFSARPKFDTPTNRVAFEAGFSRGWEAAMKEMSPMTMQEFGKEIGLLRRALDDLGVTPEEARAGALRSKERQNEVERLRARLEWNPECPAHDGIYCRDETIRLQDRQIANLKSALESKQAKIDALMLEFCPGEMPAAQVGNWAKHQRPVDENTRDAINSSDSDQAHIAKLRADVERLRKLLWAWRWAGYSRARDAETDSVLGGWNPDAGVTLADEAQAMGLYDVPGDEKRYNRQS